MSSTDTTKVKTPIAILSYPHLDRPQAPQNGQGKAKFSATLVFTKEQQATPQFKAMIEAAKAAAVEKFGAKGASMVKVGGKGSTFRNDIEGKGYPEGSIFVNVRTEQQPGLVFRHADPTTKKPAVVPQEKIREVFYAGKQVLATLRAFGYDNSGNKGISFALNNMQAYADGERLDSRTAAEDDFTADLSETPADIESLVS